MAALVFLGITLASTGCTARPRNPVHRTASPPVSLPAASAQPGAWAPPPATTPSPEPIAYALVSADGRNVTVMAMGGGCTEDAHLFAAEDEATVRLRLMSYTATKAHACPTNLLFWMRSAELAVPLDNRRLIDDAKDASVPYFDGKRLAHVGWLPPEAEGPSDRPDGHGWSRVYGFPSKTAAPLDIEQIQGDHLSDRMQPNPVFRIEHTHVHHRLATILTQSDSQGRLVQSRLGWVEGGYTFVVQSAPEKVPQQPLEPTVLEHVAAALQL